MNCFDLLCQASYAMLLTVVTGTVMLLFWWSFQKILRKISPDLVYPLLKFTNVFFLFPVVYIFISVHKTGGNYLENGLPFVVIGKRMGWAFGAASLLLLAIELFELGFFMNRYYCLSRGLGGSYAETDSVVLGYFTQIQLALKIKKQVRLAHSLRVKQPKLTGVIFPQVLLPNQPYLQKEYEVVFMHELMHCKLRDMWSKLVSNLLRALYWFNPLVHKSIKAAEHWREFNCDVHVCEHESMPYTPKEYYHCILDIVERGQGQPEDEGSGLYAGLCSGKTNLERRVETMNEYIASKKYPRWLAFAVVFVFVITSVPTACAAGMAVVNLERQLTEKMIVEDCVEEDEEVVEMEYILYPEDDTCENVRIMDEPACSSSTRSSSTNGYEWNIPANTRYMTAAFKVTKGGRLLVAGMPSSSKITYRIGYVDEDSVIHFIYGTGDKNHIFTMDKSQKIRFFVQNCSTTSKLSITASYTYVD